MFNKKSVMLLALLLCGCAKRPITNSRIIPANKKVQIPTCEAAVVVPKGCIARQWGNGVEVQCGEESKIYICQKLAKPSPQQ